MFDRLTNSWELVKESWAVLREDKGLVIFPILAGICSLIVTLGFAIPVVLTILASVHLHGGPQMASSNVNARYEPTALHYLGMFLYYLVTYFVIVFFNTGLVACVRARFAGHTATVQDGLRFSMDNIGRIFMWALISATVGTLLKFVQERVGLIGKIVTGLVGIAWTLATSFVVPVLVYEQVGPIEALKRSAEAFKRTWGEQVVGNFGIGIAFGWLAILGILPMIVGVALGAMLMSTSVVLGVMVMAGLILLSIAYWVGLSIVQSALQGIFLTACYEYSRTGMVPSVFTPQYVIGAWRPK